jgi:hypothetical protein
LINTPYIRMATFSITSLLYIKKPMISKFPYGGVPTLMDLLTKLSVPIYYHNSNILSTIFKNIL